MFRNSLIAAVVAFGIATSGGAVEFPDGFSEEVVFSGLTAPTAVRFAPDGRIFVAEKSGRVLAFDSLTDTTPDLVVDIGLVVHDFWDRGLLGLAVDPDFPVQPYIYLFYTYNRDVTQPGNVVPAWPDSCPDPPGATNDGCAVDGRLVRYEIDANNALVGGEQRLLANRWCQQFPSHSVGDLVFDPLERVLYASAGDGANFNFADYGQAGGDPGSPTPENVCDDPPAGIGGDQTPPTAEGGALRSQDIRTIGDPVSLDGTLIRINPDTGAPAAGNPLLGPPAGDDTIIAYGLRNPFRFTVRPGTHEVYVSDVGWNLYEEINVVPDGTDGIVENFGWPCYEGSDRQPAFDGLDLNLCENLYSDTVDPAVPPFLQYNHADNIDPNPDPFRCSKTGSSSVTGITFYEDTAYPSNYDGALFFADYSRDCLFVMFPDGTGAPDPSSIGAFADDVANPVDLQVGPDGLLYYVDMGGGRVLRVNYNATNAPPTARIVATPSNGPAPLQLQLDGSSSSDPDPGDTLTYAWDLSDNGQYDNAFGPIWNGTSPTAGVYTVRLRVTDNSGAEDFASQVITVGNTEPTPQILSPAPSFEWAVGDTITVTGAATDPEDGALPATALDWEVLLHHCPTECHTHFIQSASGVDSIQFDAPDHEWYSYLEIRLTATDTGIPSSGGIGVLSTTTSLLLDPRSVELTVGTMPNGFDVVFGGTSGSAPIVRTVIAGSTNIITAVTPQSLLGDTYNFAQWSDGTTTPSRQIVAPDNNTTYTALFNREGCNFIDVTCDGIDDDCNGVADEDYSPTPTQCGLGPCASAGELQCIDGNLVDTCQPGTPASPIDATCDGIDEDCDGSADDDFVPGSSSCGVGACAGNSGVTTCVDGQIFDSCDPLDGAAADDPSCDGVDDDCDGVDDEDFVGGPTTCGVGECNGNVGSDSCQNGVLVDTCDPFAGASADDTVCNGRDDDCDGDTDEDFIDGPNSCGLGACAGNNGVQSCVRDPSVIFGLNRDQDVWALNLDGQNDVFDGFILVGTQAAELDPQTGRIYYFENGNDSDQFAFYDPQTGNNAVVRNYVPQLGVFPKRLASAPDGTMYMMDADENLFTVNRLTGDVTLVGTVTGLETGPFGGTGDFAFGTDGTLYVVTYESVYTVDLDTLQATLLWTDLLAAVPGQDVFTGVAYCNGVLYASDAQEVSGVSGIYEIDLVNGVANLLWLAQDYYNDLTSCPANGRWPTTFTDTCDPLDGAGPDDFTCNGIDEDCDGLTDEDYIQTPTVCGIGPCQAAGTLTCTGGVEVDTCDPGDPAAGDDTTCDDFDDDCDGMVDEDFVNETTQCGVGACEASGNLECDGGVTSDTCTPGSPLAPTDTTCDDVDDDCDGSTDEEFVNAPTECGLGVCASTGSLQCSAGVTSDTCTPGPPLAAMDTTCNNLDDDCDGSTDEEFVNAPTQCGVGACAAAGVLQCSGGVTTDTCVPGPPLSSTDTTCDGVDDDCDGQTDEDKLVPGPDGLISVSATSIDWSPVPEADSYQVVQGDLHGLRAADGDFTVATEACLGEVATTTVPLTQNPGPGEAWWYVIRARNCVGRTSYNSGGPAQIGDRDSEVDISPNACP